MSFKDAEKRFLEAAERGMTKAMLELQRDTMALTHVDKGNLRRSWTHEVENSGSVITGCVGSNLEYAKYEDALHPNLTEAIDTNLSKYFDTISRELKKRW